MYRGPEASLDPVEDAALNLSPDRRRQIAGHWVLTRVSRESEGAPVSQPRPEEKELTISYMFSSGR